MAYVAMSRGRRRRGRTKEDDEEEEEGGQPRDRKGRRRSVMGKGMMVEAGKRDRGMDKMVVAAAASVVAVAFVFAIGRGGGRRTNGWKWAGTDVGACMGVEREWMMRGRMMRGWVMRER